MRVVHSMNIIADVLGQFSVRLARGRASPTQFDLIEHVEHGLTALVFHGVAPLRAKVFRRRLVPRMQQLSQIIELLGRMIEIQNPYRERKIYLDSRTHNAFLPHPRAISSPPPDQNASPSPVSFPPVDQPPP